METVLSLDTSFLIDLQRERRRAKDGPAMQVLTNNPQAVLWCSAVAWGEFLEGLESGADHPVARFMRRHLDVYPVTESTASLYSQAVAGMRASGSLIGANDCWIGVAALEQEHPLVTKNGRDFNRIPGLRVLSY